MSSTPNLFHAYFRIQIKEGQEATYFQLFDQIVDIFTREEGVVRCEVFYQEESRTMVWLETYESETAFMGHLTNPEVHAIQPKVFPLIELQSVIVYSPISDQLKEMLNQLPTNYYVGNAMPGTLRLEEAKTGEPQLQVQAHLDLNNLEGYRKLSAQVEAAAAQQDGVLYHQSFDLGANQVSVLEAYSTAQTALGWATSPAIQALGPGMQPLLNGLTVEVFVDQMTEAAKNAFDPWGGTYFVRKAGFNYFDQLKAKLQTV